MEYLIASLVGSLVGIKISPPLNVVALWRLHLVEAKSYRKLVRSIRSTKLRRDEHHKEIKKHVDPSMVTATNEDRGKRFRATRNLYLLVLDFKLFMNDEEILAERGDIIARSKGRQDNHKKLVAKSIIS